MELRDGRRLSIPLSLLRQPEVATLSPTNLAFAGHLRSVHDVSGVVGSTADDFSSLGGSEFSSEDDDISLVWEDPEVVGEGNKLVCWGSDDDPLVMEPLAISKPEEDGMRDVGAALQVHEAEVNPSDWVVGRLKRIGKILGASYKGNEESITRLLIEIDGRRIQNSREVKATKNMKGGGKGIRELNSLTCSINYGSDSAKIRGTSRKGLQHYLNEFENYYLECSGFE